MTIKHNRPDSTTVTRKMSGVTVAKVHYTLPARVTYGEWTPYTRNCTCWMERPLFGACTCTFGGGCFHCVLVFMPDQMIFLPFSSSLLVTQISSVWFSQSYMYYLLQACSYPCSRVNLSCMFNLEREGGRGVGVGVRMFQQLKRSMHQRVMEQYNAQRVPIAGISNKQTAVLRDQK